MRLKDIMAANFWARRRIDGRVSLDYVVATNNEQLGRNGELLLIADFIGHTCNPCGRE
jgi:hypothetical protein